MTTFKKICSHCKIMAHSQFDQRCSEICSEFTQRVTKKRPSSTRSVVMKASGPVVGAVGFVLLVFGLR